MHPRPIQATLLAAFLLAAGSGAVLAARGAQEPAPPRRRPADGKEQQEKELPPPIDFTEADHFFAIADYDGNGWISYREAKPALEIDQVRYFAFDTDHDGRIELEEFRKVYADAIRKVGAFPPPLPDPDRSDPNSTGFGGTSTPGELVTSARTIEELFGRVEERDDGPDAQPRPPHLVGPVPMFRRLDLDDDGLISVQDLVELGRPLAHPVRVPTLIAILDTDKDGAVSRAEFKRSMQSKPTPR